MIRPKKEKEMLTYKFAIGQQVLVSMIGKNWDDDYELPAIIIGFGNVILNGVPTYNLRTIHDEILNEIIETRMKEKNK